MEQEDARACKMRDHGLRRQEKRDAAFGKCMVVWFPVESAVAAALCQRSPKRNSRRSQLVQTAGLGKKMEQRLPGAGRPHGWLVIFSQLMPCALAYIEKDISF